MKTMTTRGYHNLPSKATAKCCNFEIKNISVINEKSDLGAIKQSALIIKPSSLLCQNRKIDIKETVNTFYSTGENKYTHTWIDVILLSEINF